MSLPPVTLVNAATLPTTSPDDAAVVYLIDHHRYLIMNAPSSRAATWTEAQEHRVFKVLTEEGFPVGSTHITVPKGARLKELRARTITPQGEVIDVDVSTVLSATYQFDSETSGETRSFQFPRVEVGSVLEYTSTIVYDFPMWSSFDQIAGDYPILDYQLEIVVDRWARPDLLINNASPTLRQEVLPDGRQVIGFAMQNVKPVPRAWYRPSDRALAPWWIYRTIEWRFPRVVERGLSTWGAASRALHEAVVEHKNLGAFAVRGHETCEGDVHCVVRTALATLHEDVQLSGFDSRLRIRPLEEVHRARLATNHELAVALWWMLRGVNIEAQLAPTARNGSPAVLEDFPAPAWLDHTVVYVPTSEGALWVDPSCEACEAGELPSWSRGARAVVLSTRAGEYRRELAASAFVDVTGRAAPVSREVHDVDVTVQDSGDVEVQVLRTLSGTVATDTTVEVHGRTDEELRRRLKAEIKMVSPVAELLTSERMVCDRRAGRCQQRYSYRVPGQATVIDGGNTLLLGVPELTAPLDALVVDEQKPREVPIQFRSDFELEERVTVHAPAGYVVDLATSGHKARHQETEGLRVDVAADLTADGAVVTRTYAASAGVWAASRLPEFHEVLKPARDYDRKALNIVKQRPAAPPDATAPAAPTGTAHP